jgi:hypothetical protein
MRLIYLLLRRSTFLRIDLVQDRLLLPAELRLLPQPELIQHERDELEQLPERPQYLQRQLRGLAVSQETVVSVQRQLQRLRWERDAVERRRPKRRGRQHGAE